jgi:hypothetical protein
MRLTVAAESFQTIQQGQGGSAVGEFKQLTMDPPFAAREEPWKRLQIGEHPMGIGLAEEPCAERAHRPVQGFPAHERAIAEQRHPLGIVGSLRGGCRITAIR